MEVPSSFLDGHGFAACAEDVVDVEDVADEVTLVDADEDCEGVDSDFVVEKEKVEFCTETQTENKKGINKF